MSDRDLIDDEWALAVAAQAKMEDVERVRAILDGQGVPGARVLPARRRLRIEGMHFSGVKNLAAAPESTKRNFIPFSFTHEFAPLVTAFATLGRNDAGKSSIINVILWALKGRTELQGDVRSWIRQAAVEFTVADQRLLVLWRVEGGRPLGQVLALADNEVDWSAVDAEALRVVENIAGGYVSHESNQFELEPTHALPIETLAEVLTDSNAVRVATFEGDSSFEQAMSEVMMSRLGFETTETWQANRGAADADDGTLVRQGWPLWSQALVITDPSVKVTLGETGPRASMLLQTYLGTAWGPAVTAAKTRMSVVLGEIAAKRRLRTKDDNARKEGLEHLTAQLADLEQQLAAIPDAESAEVRENLYQQLLDAVVGAAAAEELMLAKANEYGHLQRELEGAQADAQALEEAAVTQRFWHSLKPSCCPRCDAEVNEERWRREAEGSCSLCDSPIGLHDEGPKEIPVAGEVADPATDPQDEDPNDLELVRRRVDALKVACEESSKDHDSAIALRDEARKAKDAAESRVSAAGPDYADRRRLEREHALITGRIEERLAQSVPDEDLDVREEIATVLSAADVVARKRRDEEQRLLLSEVSQRVQHLGRELGITQLESAVLRANTHLPVVKGGKPMNFGSLTEGERMRLKIAVVVALLHVGSKAGVGRHPGLLIIDSLAREELNADNVKTLLHELSKVAEEYDLQVVTSSAYGELVGEALPAGAVRLAGSDDFMW